jgi:phage terminase large subunit-like protein
VDLAVQQIASVVAGPDTVVTRGSSYENRGNLAQAFFESMLSRYAGTRLGRQELEAEILEDLEGALWSRNLLDETRVQRDQVPELKRIVVAIDPAVSHGEDSDETGIIACGLGTDGHGYVLQDDSGRYHPNEWARRAIALYRRYGADRIIAEQNQGGALVESTLRAVDASIPFRGVHASRGKMVRAEPISALFEQRRCHVVGSFPILEVQLCSYAGGGNSPDRLDGMVYALTELAINKSTTGIIDYYRELVEEQRAAIPGSEVAQEERANVVFRVPDGISDVFLLSGRHIRIGVDRLVTVSERDAVPLCMAGWQELVEA